METIGHQEPLGKLLSPCPRPGQGVHSWLYGAVCTLLRHKTPPEAIEGILEPRMTRREQPGEIDNTIENALDELRSGKRVMKGGNAKIAHPFRRVDRQNGQQRARKKWERSFAHSRRFPRKLGGGIQTLPEPGADFALGIRPRGIRLHGRRRPEARMATANTTTSRPFRSKGRSRLHPQRNSSFPIPFASRRGRTKTGKPTNKSDSQVASRRFVVIEFDFRAFEWTCNLPRQEMLVYQARLHWHLSLEYPLCLLVYSRQRIAAWLVCDRAARLS